MESPSQGRKSGLPAQLLAKACASSNFSLFGHFCAPDVAMSTFPESEKEKEGGKKDPAQNARSLVRVKLQHNREGPSRGVHVPPAL
ncbi:hypothetical protein F2P81_020950 [Scophthalmus maximus]|uniref:Uncharacterized protein n=1 Tax=Scophthalmus maximus TaxID=52904 RepID=A0A6A4RVZ2_SCOMX|nr:hypothetical protein F2P81_020950 [Scophthalmus maximus]